MSVVVLELYYVQLNGLVVEPVIRLIIIISFNAVHHLLNMVVFLLICD